MPVNYPKFDQKIQNQIDSSAMQKSRTRPGVITSYDRVNNTATIVLDEQYSNSMGSVVRNVPCPLVKGVQSVSPVAGTRCLVGFRDSNEANPYVINYFDDVSSNKSYLRTFIVNTGIPRFMVH